MKTNKSMAHSKRRDIFQAKITVIYPRALTQQIVEATKIKSFGAKAINNKLKWRHTKVTARDHVTRTSQVPEP